MTERKAKARATALTQRAQRLPSFATYDEQRKQQIPRGNDRKKSKGKGNGFDAKGAKVAKFRQVRRATEEADSQRE